MGDIEGRLSLTEHDLAAGIRAMPEQRRARWSTSIATAVFPIFLTVMFNLDPFGSPPLFLLCLAAAVASWRLFTQPARTAHQQFEAMKPTQREIQYRFSEVGVVIESAVGKTELAYSAFQRSVEGPETFLFYTAANLAQVIPKRAFGDGDVDHVSELIRKRVENRPAPSTAHRALILWVILIASLLTIWNILRP